MSVQMRYAGTMKYLFIGDKFPVLNWMLEEQFEVVGCLIAKNFFATVPLEHENITPEVIEDRTSLYQRIQETEFDVLVSNGCPYILPVSELKKEGQIWVNIHASLLPSLKGPHPINGAIFNGVDSGATCHHMVDEMDSGDIISQVKIPLTDDIDLGLLYMLMVEAETDAFKLAHKRGFETDSNVTPREESYFKREPELQEVNWNLEPDAIVRQIRAFGIYSQAARFTHQGHAFKVFQATLITNPYMLTKLKHYKDREVVYVYDNTVVIRKSEHFIRLTNVHTETGNIQVGDILGQ